MVLSVLVLTQTALAVWSLAKTFPYPQLSNLQVAILGVFAVLFCWISFSFWAALAGFWTVWRKRRSTLVQLADAPGATASRTAILMPICNEPVDRVFAGVESCYRSLEKTGELTKFDFYFLSDTNDPEARLEEEVAWARICRRVSAFGKIFYRHRRVNIKRKSGNIADFVRRWGQNYDYMIVFDADSIVSGETLLRMAALMDANPQVGVLQTAPTIFNGESLFARVQQFSSRVFGPIFNAGLQFWQGGESYYWGHNAILRMEPFIRHCGLPRLPGRPPLGGDIMSHDFVEAALMGRAGWEIWVVDHLPESYEESPPTILDELKRDRRWCQGNIQHLRLILGDRIRFGHRAIMAMGIMAYASAFLWASFLILSTAEVAVELLIPPVYFSATPSLFPAWPQWHPEIAIALLTTTALLLCLPKFLSVLLIARNGNAAHYGGTLRLCVSVALEIVISTLLAPVRMWFHAKYVFLTLLGREIKWDSQRRGGVETGWIEALRHHGVSMLAGLGLMTGLFWFTPRLAWWVLPVALPLGLSGLLSVLSSKKSFGTALRQWRLLMIPEETAPPEILRRLKDSLADAEKEKRGAYGFMRAVEDPLANAVHVAVLRGKSAKSTQARERIVALRQKAILEGPENLGETEIKQLLFDARAMVLLHDFSRKKAACHPRQRARSPVAQ